MGRVGESIASSLCIKVRIIYLLKIFAIAIKYLQANICPDVCNHSHDVLNSETGSLSKILSKGNCQFGDLMTHKKAT